MPLRGRRGRPAKVLASLSSLKPCWWALLGRKTQESNKAGILSFYLKARLFFALTSAGWTEGRHKLPLPSEFLFLSLHILLTFLWLGDISIACWIFKPVPVDRSLLLPCLRIRALALSLLSVVAFVVTLLFCWDILCQSRYVCVNQDINEPLVLQSLTECLLTGTGHCLLSFSFLSGTSTCFPCTGQCWHTRGYEIT